MMILFSCLIETCSSFYAYPAHLRPQILTACSLAKSSVSPQFLLARRNAGTVVMKKKPDIYDEASVPFLRNLPGLFGFLILFIGGQALLGDEGTRQFGQWMSEGPFGGLVEILGSPMVTREPVVDALGTAYDTKVVPSSGFALIVVYQLIRRGLPALMKRIKSSAEADSTDSSPPPPPPM